MELPRISASRLRRVVADAEFPDAAESFEALCDTCAAGTWAENLKLDSDTIGRLIVAHEIVTKVETPEAVAEEPVAPKLPKTTARPPASEKQKKKKKKPEIVDDDPQPTVVETVLKGGVKSRPMGIGISRIHAPAGNCPHRLQGISLSEVRDWAEKVRDSGFPSDGAGKLYTYHALRYFATHFYNQSESFLNPDCDFIVVVGHLKTLYPDEVSR